MDVYFIGALVVALAVTAMTISNNIRQMFFMPQGKDSSAMVDGVTGLIILAAAVTAMAFIPDPKTANQNSIFSPAFLDALRELIKLTLGAIGAMYVKSCYEKHDKAWKEKCTPAFSNSSTCTTRKTMLFYQDEICGEGEQATANSTSPKTP